MMGTSLGNMMGGTGAGGFDLLGSIPMLLFWGLLIMGAFALFRYFGTPIRESSKEKSAMDILNERFAKGEIDEKEYGQKKKALV
jgi:putative membrane protein